MSPTHSPLLPSVLGPIRLGPQECQAQARKVPLLSSADACVLAL